MSSILIPRRRQGTGINIAQGLVIGVVLTGLSYMVGFGAGWIETINWLEIAAVFTSYVCTFLCVMERRINYPVGAVSTTLYCILFFNAGLLASAAINGFLAVYLVYGWFRWRHDAGTLVVTRMTLPAWAVHIVVALVTYAIVFGIATALGGTLAWTDSVILVGTVLAQFMLDNKKYENWMVWAVVNVFAIYTYFTAGLALAGFQYVFFLLNAFYGLHQWKESMDAVPDDISTLDEAPATIAERYGR